MIICTTVLGRRVPADDWRAVQGDRALKILLDWTVALPSIEAAPKNPLDAATISSSMSLVSEKFDDVIVDLAQRGLVAYALDGSRIRGVWLTRDGLYYALNSGCRDE